MRRCAACEKKRLMKRHKNIHKTEVEERQWGGGRDEEKETKKRRRQKDGHTRGEKGCLTTSWLRLLCSGFDHQDVPCRTGREAHIFLGEALSPLASAPPPSLHPATNCPHGLVLCAHRGNSTSKSITSRQLLQSPYSKASWKVTEEPGHSSCLREED